MSTTPVTPNPAQPSPVELDLSTFAPFDSGRAAAASNLRQSVTYGVQQNPDQYAKLLKQQQVTGMSPEVAAPSSAETQNAIDVESLNPEQMVISHPRTAAWAANPDNAAVAGTDELQRLTRIETGAATLRAWTPGFLDKVKSDAVDATQFMTGKTPAELKASAYEYPLTRAAIDATGGAIETAGNIGSFFGWHGDDATRQNLLQRAATSLTPEANVDPESPYAKSNALDALVRNVAPMIPAVVASGGTSLLADTLGLSDKAAKVLGALSVGSMFSADQGGQTFTQMAASGKSDQEARRAALLTAGISAPFNIGMGLTGVVPGIRDYPLLSTLGVGAGAGATSQLAQNVVTGKPLGTDVGKAALQSAAVMGGFHLGSGFLEQMGEITNEVEQSKLRARSPEAHQQAMNAVFDGDPSVRVPAEDFINYFQAKKIDPAAMANQVGVTNLDEAAAAGSDLEIPKANFFGQLDPEHQRGLLPDLVDPSTELTARQAEGGRQELQDWVAGGGAEKLQAEFTQADAETQATPEWQQVYGDLKQRYVDAGESDTAADSYATLQANAISNLAKNAGLKPDELLALHNPKITAGEPQGQTLFQGAPDEGENAELSDEEKQALAKVPARGWKNSEDLLEYRDELKSLVDKGLVETRRGDEWGTDFRRIKQPSVSSEAPIAAAEPAAQPVEESTAQASAAAPAAENRGWFKVLPDGRYEIGKTSIGDFSTFIHEPAHAYLELFRELTQREGASEPLKDDFKKITEWLGTTPEEAQKNGFTREQHEEWARANEQYVREGTAPTAGLRRALRNFGVWLGSIYRRASSLGVELHGDIRGVMDRLYAGEDAVNRADQEAGDRQLFKTPEEAGLTEDEYRNYAEAKGIAVDKAREQVRAELNEAAERDKTQEWREERGDVHDAVTEQIDARPEYKAIRSLRRGKTDLGTDLTLNRDALVSQFGEERVKALQDLHRGLYRNEGGTDAETAAELLGFGSGDEMMRAMESAPRRAQAIEAGTRDYLVNKYGDVRYDGTLMDKARFALENQERAKSIYREVKTLRERVASLQQKAADSKAAMAAITTEPLERYQEAARQMIDNKAIADLQPHRYLDASRKFSREAFDALRKGNVKAAADAKNKELLNHFLFREASAARDYAEKFESYAKRMQSRGIQQRMGLAGSDYRDQFNWLMARYKLGPSAPKPARSLSEWADDMQGQGKETAIDPGILDSKYADYRSVPVSEVHSLHDALVNIRHLAQQEFKMYVQGKQIVFADGKAAMLDRARESFKVKPEFTFEHNRPVLDRAIDPVRYVDARLLMTERSIEWLDGGKDGPWHDNVWNPMADAQGDEDALQHEVTQTVLGALEKMPPGLRRRLWTEKVAVEGVSEPLTRRDMVSMAFNMGNEGNLDRLKKTFAFKGWDPDAIRKIGGMLTREEWQFVQGTWDALKPLGERADELQKRLTGLPLSKVKVTPFKVALDDGTEMNLDGGYYPIVYDPKDVVKGYDEEAAKSAQNAMQAGYVRATTSKGYTKERTGSAGPLLLDYEKALSSHVAKVTKDLSHREAMLSTQRFLLDPQVISTLRETIGPKYEEQMMPWLRAIINDNNGSVQERLDGLKDLMQKSRANFVTASLAFNPGTVLLQISHAPRMLLYARPASLAQSFVDLLGRPFEATREIRELSPNEMRFRGDHLDRDLRGVLQKSAFNGYERKVAVAGRLALQLMDHMLSHTLWRAAFNDALVKHDALSPEEAQSKAAYEADSAVRLGLGAHAPKDLPAIMRNNEFNKFITTLYGFHNGIYNQFRDIGHQFRSDQNVGKLTCAAILSSVLPAVLGSWLTGQRPKDDENAGWWAAKRSLLFAADTIPIARAVASAMEGGHDVQFSPIETVLTKGAKSAMEAASSKDDKDWLGIGLNEGEAVGDLLGVPGAHQAAKTLRYIKRANEGRVENPNLWNAIVGGGR